MELKWHKQGTDCLGTVTSVSVQGHWEALFKETLPFEAMRLDFLTTMSAWSYIKRRFIKFNRPEYYYIKNTAP